MPAGTITALRAQEQDAQRVSVFVDGVFALGISLTTLSRERLYVGQQLSADDFARLEAAESADRAAHAALRLLESRPRSTAEVRERLQRKRFAPEAIEAAIARLGELGLLDDDAFARFWVENRQSYRPRGRGALRDELRRKGVAPAVVESAIDAADVAADEPASAAALARAALHRYASAPDRASFTRRLGGYLQRRGYDFEIIRPIVEQLWAELHSATEP